MDIVTNNWYRSTIRRVKHICKLATKINKISIASIRELLFSNTGVFI